MSHYISLEGCIRGSVGQCFVVSLVFASSVPYHSTKSFYLNCKEPVSESHNL